MTDSGDPEKRDSSRKRTIESGPTQIPADFRLVIDFGPSHNCEIVRKSRDQIAVQFV